MAERKLGMKRRLQPPNCRLLGVCLDALGSKIEALRRAENAKVDAEYGYLGRALAELGERRLQRRRESCANSDGADSHDGLLDKAVAEPWLARRQACEGNLAVEEWRAMQR